MSEAQTTPVQMAPIAMPTGMPMAYMMVPVVWMSMSMMMLPVWPGPSGNPVKMEMAAQTVSLTDVNTGSGSMGGNAGTPKSGTLGF